MKSSPLIAPKQDRSRRTLDRIVRASIEILEDEGPEGLTVQAIVNRAGASVGSFYARFGGKDDLVDYLGERIWKEAAEQWDRALEEERWSELDLAGAVGAAVRLLDASGRSRHTILAALGSVRVGEAAFLAFQDHVLVGLEELLSEKAERVGTPEPRLAARLGLRAVLGALSTPLGSIPSQAAEAATLTAERRAGEAQRMLFTYLSGQASPGSAEAGQVDFFDIWG